VTRKTASRLHQKFKSGSPKSRETPVEFAKIRFGGPAGQSAPRGFILILHREGEDMHLSDVSLDCAQECSRLAVFCTDEVLAKRLRSIALRLHSAALEDATLCEAPSEQDLAGKAESSGADRYF
jgi:hypothetical protein